MGMPSVFARVWLALVLLLVLSCGGSGEKTTAPSAPALTTITVALSASTLTVGQTASASATGLDQNGVSISIGTGSVSWSSSSPTVATISAVGAITAAAAGQTTITATVGSRSGQATLTVSPVPVASVIVSPNVTALAAGGTQQLTASTLDANGGVLSGRSVSWSTSDATKATVSPTGLVTAVSAGSATITATSEGKSGTARATVSVVASVTVEPAALTMVVGDTRALTVTLRDAGGTVLGGVPTGLGGNGSRPGWNSTDEAKVSVNETGTVTAKAAGYSWIYLDIRNGIRGSADVTATLTPAPVPSEPSGLKYDVAVDVPSNELAIVKAGIDFARVYLSSSLGGDITSDQRGRITVKVIATGLGDTSPSNLGNGCTGLDVNNMARPFFDVRNSCWDQGQGGRIGPENHRLHTAAHEYAHGWQNRTGCLGSLSAGAPYTQLEGWITEGAGEFVAYRALSPFRLDAETVRKFMLFSAVYSMESADSLRSYEYLGQAYATWPGHIGFLALEYLTDLAPSGVLSLRTHCEAIARGTDRDAAFLTAFGVSKASFYATFPSHIAALRARYGI